MVAFFSVAYFVMKFFVFSFCWFFPVFIWIAAQINNIIIIIIVFILCIFDIFSHIYPIALNTPSDEQQVKRRRIRGKRSKILHLISSSKFIVCDRKKSFSQRWSYAAHKKIGKNNKKCRQQHSSPERRTRTKEKVYPCNDENQIFFEIIFVSAVLKRKNEFCFLPDIRGNDAKSIIYCYIVRFGDAKN